METQIKSLTAIGALSYEDVRDDCHLVKTGERRAMLHHAARMAAALPDRSVLIPIPSHTGEATYTRMLAWDILREALRLRKECRIRDVAVCAPRQSLCELKRAGKDISSVDVSFHFRRPSFDRRELELFENAGYRRVLVDNVVDTGTTAMAMMELVGDSDIAAIGDTDL